MAAANMPGAIDPARCSACDCPDLPICAGGSDRWFCTEAPARFRRDRSKALSGILAGWPQTGSTANAPAPTDVGNH